MARNGGPQNRLTSHHNARHLERWNEQGAWLPASDYPGMCGARSLRSMVPVMWAALIGVGGSVIVALVGFYTTRHISVMTMRVSMDEAHNNRIWDKRAVAYERALAELANRQVRRERAIYLPTDTMTPTETMTAAKLLETYFAVRDTPEWSEAEGQLLAYSTQDVWDALKNARSAERTAAGLFDDDLVGPMHKASDLQEAGHHSASQRVIDEQLLPAVQRTSDGLSGSAERDQALIDQIRKELQEQRD
jgi:hypothetical protein